MEKWFQIGIYLNKCPGGWREPSIALIYRQARWTMFISGKKGTGVETVLVMLYSLRLIGVAEALQPGFVVAAPMTL